MTHVESYIAWAEGQITELEAGAKELLDATYGEEPRDFWCQEYIDKAFELRERAEKLRERRAFFASGQAEGWFRR